MPVARKCTECGKSLEGKPPTAKTCSQEHRQARARRIKRQEKEKAERMRRQSSLPDHLATASAAAQGNMEDVVHEAMLDEVRPLVREAITEDVLRGINDLVAMTPTAVNNLKADLASPDDTLRHKATTLLLKYTLGNPSVAPAPTEQAPSPMQVVFNLPRPGDTPPEPGEAVELKTCNECQTERALHEFVAGSMRCNECDARVRELIEKRLGS